MKLSLERNLATDSSAEVYPYIIRLEIVMATKDVGHVYQIPVFVRYRGLEKSYGVDVCGFRLVAKHPSDLLGQVEALVKKLISTARLPTYIFVARRSQLVVPVYTVHDEVVAFTATGPVFRHVELAKVREYLTDYLHEIRVLGEDGRDKLHVRGIGATTLGLRRPVFYLKKRVATEVDFWAPVFQSGDGRRIYAYAASNRQEVERSDENAVFVLREKVANALIADRRLRNTYDLRPDRLMPAFWENLSALLDRRDTVRVRGVKIDLYYYRNEWIAMETREDEGRYGLFLDCDAERVLRRVEEDFARRGIG